MSTLHHDSLYETCYDEAWIDYAKQNNLSYDELTALEQSSETGIIPAIEIEARKRFEDLLQ